MSALHEALQTLGPVPFSEVPKAGEGLDTFLDDLFENAETVLESIPIPDPTNHDETHFHVASNASEITPSSARSAAPAAHHAALQKEWGKPVKLGAKDNPLSMSVYKLGAKDGRGAWFARRSVHEGIGFNRFKQSLEMEFEQSMAVEGTGQGNVRGIGGEIKVEEIDVPGKGKVEVYRLSAQFPGPTTPRDFVTFLVTSDKAIASGKKAGKDHGALAPRHYMVLSKPCDHPEAQPRDGFIRGHYESVEFIREVPRKLKASMSTTNLAEDDIARHAQLRNAHQKVKTSPIETEQSQSVDALNTDGRLRSSSSASKANDGGYNPEENPVEWIMITRSDPGGSVPRFMVERGTPGSICADAKKFLDWACQRDLDVDGDHPNTTTTTRRPRAAIDRQESYQSWRGSRVAGVHDGEHETVHESSNAPPKIPVAQPESTQSAGYGGIMGAVTGAVSSLSAYTPQVILDHLPHQSGPADTTTHPQPVAQHDPMSTVNRQVTDDTASIKSTSSFASAEDHLTSADESVDTFSSRTSPEKTAKLTQHEKELQKLQERKLQLTSKFEENRLKLEQQSSEHTAKEEAAHKKALEKHEKEVHKQEERYQKELKKLEQKQEKERKKLEEKQMKQAEKDDKLKIIKERDILHEEIEILKQENKVLRDAMEDLQRENTVLVARLGKVGIADVGGTVSRSSSMKHVIGVDGKEASPRGSTSKDR